MCAPASFVLTKDSVFWSMNSDGHEDIIAEHELCQDGVRGPNILRVEITPPDKNFAADAARWQYRLDQDTRPEWYDAANCERRARIALNDWIAARVVREGAKRVSSGRLYACGSATVYAYGSATVEACGSATVYAVGSATVKTGGSATVKAYDSATVKACGSATVYAYDSATVEAYDSATVKACGGLRLGHRESIRTQCRQTQR